MTTTVTVTLPTTQQRRLRSVVKRLVIDLGYLEHCLAEGLQDANVRKATKGLDSAIDRLNEHLAQ
ncbi:MAG: hypothetical protein AAFX01_14345 [Cyanobacteria bacterium J06638_28]